MVVHKGRMQRWERRLVQIQTAAEQESHVTDPDIRLWGGQFNMFLSISSLFLCLRGPRSIATLNGGPRPISPLEDWIHHWCLTMKYLLFFNMYDSRHRMECALVDINTHQTWEHEWVSSPFCPPIFWFAHPIFLTSLRQWSSIKCSQGRGRHTRTSTERLVKPVLFSLSADVLYGQSLGLYRKGESVTCNVSQRWRLQVTTKLA